MSAPTPATQNAAPAVTARACLFRVGERVFATAGAFNRQFVRIEALTPVPRAPHALLGLFAVRGQVRPLYHLERLLDLPTTLQKLETAALFEVGGQTFALAVDVVLGLPALNPNLVFPLGNDLPASLRPFSHGEVGLEGHRAVMLDLEQVLHRVQGQGEAIPEPGLLRPSAL